MTYYNAIYIYVTSKFTTTSTLEAISSTASVQTSNGVVELTAGIYRSRAPVDLTPVVTADYDVTTFGAKGDPPVDPPLRATQVFDLTSTEITQMLTNGLGYAAAV